MSENKTNIIEPKTTDDQKSVEVAPEVCLRSGCVDVIYRPGNIIDVIVRNTCSINLKDKAKQAAQELLSGKIKMRYTVEE